MATDKEDLWDEAYYNAQCVEGEASDLRDELGRSRASDYTTHDLRRVIAHLEAIRRKINKLAHIERAANGY